MVISKNQIESAKEISKYLTGWMFARNTITQYFDINRLNECKETVLTKVVLIDSLYKTNINENINIAEHISAIEDLDGLLCKGSVEAVEKIRIWKKDILSFASKYCHFHNKDEYPIFDSYVLNALKEKFDYKGERNYSKFKAKLTELKQENLNSFEELDTFLWLYGQKIALDNNTTKINYEISRLYKEKRELFNRLG